VLYVRDFSIPNVVFVRVPCARLSKERKKENRQPKGGMGERHAATTKGF